jgi:hypothetical protein
MANEGRTSATTAVYLRDSWTTCRISRLKKQITDFTMNEEETDYIILNSVSQINKALARCLEKYKQINCYLDNDQSGIAATEINRQAALQTGR